jgi:hypothetical protein
MRAAEGAKPNANAFREGPQRSHSPLTSRPALFRTNQDDILREMNAFMDACQPVEIT